MCSRGRAVMVRRPAYLPIVRRKASPVGRNSSLGRFVDTDRMVAGISIVLAVYEALALLTKRPPTITRLSHTKVGVLVWLWLASLTIHLIRGDEEEPIEERLVIAGVRALPFTRRLAARRSAN